MNINLSFTPTVILSSSPEAHGYLLDMDNTFDLERRANGSYRGGLQAVARTRPGEDAQVYPACEVLGSALVADLNAGFDLLLIDGTADEETGALDIREVVLLVADANRTRQILSLLLARHPGVRARFEQLALSVAAAFAS